MPQALIARLRRHRRSAVWMAAGLLAVQAFLAGLTVAQALVLTSGPGAADDFAVICHGNAGATSDNGAGQDPGGTDPAAHPHPCCDACTAGAAPATLPEQAVVLRADRCRAVEAPAFCPLSVHVTPRAVRAGASQAPPTLD
jgi:hypothetical protein